MKVVIFAGPTLSAEEGRRELDAVYLPPAAQGDLYRAALGKPVAIGLIDGYFERVPSVSHKEILWAMKQGVHVFGAASMGALRAAELAAFGMEGVGEIHEAFASGALEDDDEVAVVHADAEEGYQPLSEAMVNIRATLQAAQGARVLGEETRLSLEQCAKAL
ncbi:MAG TPA: TfuA-like protein, partial [Archangium sp.]|nr:TfuA-like protein [Archangium sp.]